MKKSHSNRLSAASVQQGFTLLEVMFAFMLLVFGLTMIFQIQAASVEDGKEARSLIIASQLARKKLLDCKSQLLKDGFSITDFAKDGTFSDEGFPEIRWECHGVRIDMPAPSQAAISDKIKAQENEGGGGMVAAVLGPLYTTLATAMGDSARELTAIVHWKLADAEQELRVTTHVIQTAALGSILSAFSIPGVGKPPPAPQGQPTP